MSPWPFVEPLPTRVMATAKVLGPKYVVSAICGRGRSSRQRLPRVECSAGLSECEHCAVCLAELSLVSSVWIRTLWVKVTETQHELTYSKGEVSLLIKSRRKLWSEWPQMLGFRNIKTIKCLALFPPHVSPSLSATPSFQKRRFWADSITVHEFQGRILIGCN